MLLYRYIPLDEEEEEVEELNSFTPPPPPHHPNLLQSTDVTRDLNQTTQYLLGSLDPSSWVERGASDKDNAGSVFAGWRPCSDTGQGSVLFVGDIRRSDGGVVWYGVMFVQRGVGSDSAGMPVRSTRTNAFNPYFCSMAVALPDNNVLWDRRFGKHHAWVCWSTVFHGASAD